MCKSTDMRISAIWKEEVSLKSEEKAGEGG